MLQQQKNKKENNNNNNDNVQKKKKDETKKEETPINVILKVDTHCETCRSKIARCLRGSHASSSSNMKMKLNVVVVEGECGKVEPTKLTEKVGNKMKNKKDDFISPKPTKNNAKPQDNKSKQPPLVNTVVLKVAMHCQGCIERIRRTVLKTKGVQDMAIDKEKETVTVKGTMEVKALVGNMMERLKKKVEVVPPKKENKEESGDKKGANDKGGNGDSKKKKGGGGGGGGGGGDNVKDEKGSGGGEGQGKGKGEQNKMEALESGNDERVYGYRYGGENKYEPVYMGQLHAPQFFSDENPNACNIM